jgi:uncharacterized surface anchored protein
VGRETKKVITGEESTSTRQKSTETTPRTTTSPSTRTKPSTESSQTERANKRLPATAGELPLLALTGVLALAAFGATKLVRRKD